MGKHTFVLHDGSVNTHGFRMLTEGADLTVFKENPVMLFNHDDWDLPIGRWENIRVEADRILADAVFDEADERSRNIAGKVERGFLKAASIGAWPVELSDDPATWLPGQKERTVTKWTVREASICSIPANHNALVLYDSDNKVIDLSKPNALVALFDKNKDLTMLNQNNLEMNLRKLFKLNDAASDDAVSEEAGRVLGENTSLKSENESLKAELNALKAKVKLADDARAETERTAAVELVDKAIREARISAAGREAWLSDFTGNFESARVRLASVPARQSVASQVETGQESEFVKLTWDELDRKGKLIGLKETDPSLYERKYEERFGVKPGV